MVTFESMKTFKIMRTIKTIALLFLLGSVATVGYASADSVQTEEEAIVMHIDDQVENPGTLEQAEQIWTERPEKGSPWTDWANWALVVLGFALGLVVKYMMPQKKKEPPERKF